MKIAVINSGSSSIKFQLFEMKQKTTLAGVLVEKIGSKSSIATLKYAKKRIQETPVLLNHHEALEYIISLLQLHSILSSLNTLDAIAHRVVHGGEIFSGTTQITSKVIEEIQSLIPLAPLHNKANLEGILVAQEKAPDVVQFGVFDTAFHTTMPKEAFLYALPMELYEKHNIRRYGFHGSSHAYIVQEAANLLQKEKNKLNIISLHLGNGASACAIENGKSIDTSMGFTPLEGLVMGSRSGDIDPAIVLYIQRELGVSLEECDTLLNKHSGLIGICGKNDLREILQDTSPQAKLALDVMIRRIKKYVGSYIALLGRVDAIVFTGGIGENSAYIREKVFENFPFKIRVDREKNNNNSTVISSNDAAITLMVIPTNEELYIAQEALHFLQKKSIY